MKTSADLSGHIVVRVTVVMLLLMAAACAKNPTTPTEQPPVVDFVDLVVGTGTAATADHVMNVRYTGWLFDAAKPENKGTQFDTTVGGPLFSFVLGRGSVIKGWDLGIVGMRAGGTRRLTLTPDLAYGATGSSDGKIPPNATLIFDIELVTVQ